MNETFCNPGDHNLAAIMTKSVDEQIEAAIIRHFEMTLFCTKCGFKEPLNKIEVTKVPAGA